MKKLSKSQKEAICDVLNLLISDEYIMFIPEDIIYEVAENYKLKVKDGEIIYNGENE